MMKSLSLQVRIGKNKREISKSSLAKNLVMEYFKKITQAGLIELVESTKNSLYLCMPSIHKEIANAITSLDYLNSFEEKEVEIHILLDFNPQTFRQGYGDCGEVVDIIKGGFDVRSMKDNRISFIISDEIGYYLFIESRTLIPSEKETINAVRVDPVSMVRLKQYFFKDSVQTDFQDDLTNAIIDESKLLEDESNLLPSEIAQVKEITESEILIVEKDIKENPPINPDFKRTIDYYSNKFQYAELHFEGQNFIHFSVSIPSKLLPYKNEELKKKLVTKLKLFENIIENKEFDAFKKVIEMKKQITKEYLTVISCRKGRSLISLTKKLDFKKEVEKLKKELEKVKSGLYLIMLDEINLARKGLIETLTLFLIDNPTNDMLKLDEELIPTVAKSTSENVVNRLNIPDPSKWITNFQIETNYSDITFEDLKDPILLEELKVKGIIEEEDETRLAKFGSAIDLKK